MTQIYRRGGGGGGKSQYPYVGLNSSVTECTIEIILSGMTYYHHWFKEFVNSKHVCVHFFKMKVHFRIYLIVWIVESSQILMNCVWSIKLCTFVLKQEMRPLFFFGWPLNFPIRYGVFYYIPCNLEPAALGSQSMLFISMQIWWSDRPSAAQLIPY